MLYRALSSRNFVMLRKGRPLVLAKTDRQKVPVFQFDFAGPWMCRENKSTGSETQRIQGFCPENTRRHQFPGAVIGNKFVVLHPSVPVPFLTRSGGTRYSGYLYFSVFCRDLPERFVITGKKHTRFIIRPGDLINIECFGHPFSQCLRILRIAYRARKARSVSLNCCASICLSSILINVIASAALIKTDAAVNRCF